MRVESDPLLALFRIAEGAIRINVNNHKVSRPFTVEHHLRSSPRYAVVTDDQRAKMKLNDRLVEVVVVVNRDTAEEVRTYGYSLHSATEQAVWRVMKARRLLNVSTLPSPVNNTRLFERLVDACKGPVHLTINEFKDKYWCYDTQEYTLKATAKTFLKDQGFIQPDLFARREDGSYKISPAERKAMEELNQTLEIQFYPNNSLTFFGWFDLDLGDMLEQALEIAKRKPSVD